MIFVGNDWAADHHDVCVMDEQGSVLASRRLPNDAGGITVLHQMLAGVCQDAGQVIVGIRNRSRHVGCGVDRRGYRVYAINPLSVRRYRDRHHLAGTKSDKADAKLQLTLVRTDRHNHRPVAAGGTGVAAITVMARAHQNLVWMRAGQRCAGAQLCAYYPAAIGQFGGICATP